MPSSVDENDNMFGKKHYLVMSSTKTQFNYNPENLVKCYHVLPTATNFAKCAVFFILHYHCISITFTYIVRWLLNKVTEVFLYCFSQEILELTLVEYIAVFPRDHFLYPLITVSTSSHSAEHYKNNRYTFSR